MNREEIAVFELKTLELLKGVMDPEIEINIVDLGLIYELYYDGGKKINIVMTYSTPSCPLGEAIQSNIREVISRQYPGFETVIDVVFHPQWTPANISPEGKQMLGM